MSTSHPAGLLAELPELQARGVIDADTAERLRQHYATAPAAIETTPPPVPAATPPQRSQLISAVLGSLLVGLGVLLLVAHNWDAWSRGTRLLVGLGPLLITQLLGAWVLWRRPDDIAWRESVAVASLCAFAAALAIVGQIYHFPADLGRYFLTCAVVALPLIYLFRASLTAVLGGGALLGWVIATASTGGASAPDPAWVLLAWTPLLPHVLTAPRSGFRGRALQEALLPMAVLSVLVTMFESSAFALLWVLLILGLLWWRYPPGEAGGWRAPLPRYAFFGLLAASLWAGGMSRFSALDAALWNPPSAPASHWLLVLVFGGALLVACLHALSQRNLLRAAGAVPALGIGLALFVPLGATGATLLTLAFNLYVLLLGLLLLRAGLQRGQWSLAQAGLTAIALLVLLRFFDTGLSFSLRGLGFLLVGISFLAASAWLRRRVATP